MKTEEEIKNKIEKIKQGILEGVLTGLFTEKVLQNDAMWVEALEWVLED